MLTADRTLITQAEAARRAGVSKPTIGAWIARGFLTPYVREIDGKTMVDADELARKTTFKPSPPTEPPKHS